MKLWFKCSFLLLLFILMPKLYLKGQNVTFTAEGSGTAQQGEAFQISFNISAQPSGFVAPNFNNFDIISGPNSMTSSNFEMINGKTTQSINTSYTYVLKGSNIGKFTIGPAEAIVNGKKYKSNVINIEIVKGNASNSGSNPRNNNQNQTNQTAESGNGDIFVTVQLDKRNAYLGESVIATVKLYTRIDIEGFEDVKFPSFNGFFSQDIDIPAQIQLQREIVNGVAYNAGVIKKKVLFPQRSGELTIDPCEVTLIARVRSNQPRSVFDDFFGPSIQRVRKKLISKPVKLSIRALPTSQPASFNGAVGKFNIDASVNKTNVKSNDALTYKINLSGEGNLKLIEPPKINFPQDFEVYDPKVTNNIKTSSAGAIGNKTFEYLIIPRHAGKFKIPNCIFTFFNTQTKQYSTLTTKEIDIDVEKGNETENANVVSSFSREDVKYIGKDIKYIKTHPFELVKDNILLFGSPLFILTYLVSFIIFLVLVILLRNNIKQKSDIVATKNRRANKMAIKRLKQALVYMKANKREEFFEEVVKAFWGYLSDKLYIPVSELSRDRAIAELEKYAIETENISESMNLIETCEFARYAPSSESSSMDKIYESAVNVISKLDQKIK